jgi:SAM-dependent methyltransferase
MVVWNDSGMPDSEIDRRPTVRPGDRWRRLLVESAVPKAIAGGAPETLGNQDVGRFRWRPDEDARLPERPSRRRALEALPEGGTVLDVGVGGGGSCLGLVPKPGLIIGVDAVETMLESFTASAAACGVTARAVHGRWPEVAGDVGAADVVVCHHALYRVVEIEDFVTALTSAARHRVVVELSEHPPLAALDPLWRSMHGIERLRWQVADEAQAVLEATGLPVEREDILLPPRPMEPTPELVAFARRRLYVGPDRDPEIEEFFRTRERRPQRMVALWWAGTAS